MGAREQVQRKIDQKQQEIRELQAKIRDAEIYIQALQELNRVLPKEANGSQPEQKLRKGSLVYQAREAIKAAGHPVHISDLLRMLGLPVDKKRRASLSGSISGYARRGEIFTRPEPNTFGLLELKSQPQEPSADFGLPSESEITDDDIPF
jgi:TolA-binding protein